MINKVAWMAIGALAAFLIMIGISAALFFTSCRPVLVHTTYVIIGYVCD